MALELTGRIVVKLPQETGTSKAGKDWVKQDIVIETEEQYPKKICFTVMGAEKIKEFAALPVGRMITVGINIESREYNGKWFTNVNCWRVSSQGNSGEHAAPASQSETFGADPEGWEPAVDDLPF